jgi:cytosine/adenosine deaminase-related metal-dependent hydrolase
MLQTRILMSLQLASPIGSSLLIFVVLWAMFLFCGFGVLSGANTTTIVALGMGSFAVGSAGFLIIDMSEPYGGLFRVPPDALVQALQVIGK